MKTKILLIVCAIIFGLAQFGLFTFSLFNQRTQNKQGKEVAEMYFSSMHYYLKGKVVDKKLVFNCGTKYRNNYLLTIAVDTFIIQEDDVPPENLFIGVYDDSIKTAYIVSRCYSNSNDNELPFIEVSTQKQMTTFSNGVEVNLSVSDWTDILQEKENAQTIRF